MSDLGMIRAIVRETVSRQRCPRVAEPDAVMASPDSVAAYSALARDMQVIMQSYLISCAQLSEVIRPGDTVLDLGCGPGTLLAMCAKLNPESRFIGVDLSDGMLAMAQTSVQQQQIDNVELRRADISALADFADRSIDAVVSTFSLHHLPSLEALARTFGEIDRVLADRGGLFLLDLAHLKSERSIHYIAHRHAHLQSPTFTEDYENSLRAAFYVDDVERLQHESLGSRARLYAMAPMRLMFAIKSEPRQTQRLEPSSPSCERRSHPRSMTTSRRSCGCFASAVCGRLCSTCELAMEGGP
jgi:arsenite methyltransferase